MCHGVRAPHRTNVSSPRQVSLKSMRTGIGNNGPTALALTPGSNFTSRKVPVSLTDLPFGSSGSNVFDAVVSDLGMGAGNMGFFLIDWIGDTFSADQYCEAVISPEVTTSPE